MAVSPDMLHSFGSEELVIRACEDRCPDGAPMPGDTGDDRRFAAAAGMVLPAEPVPVAAGVGRAGLFRVGDQERVLLGQLVHAGSGGEIGRVLAAAVQHLDDLRLLAGSGGFGRVPAWGSGCRPGRVVTFRSPVLRDLSLIHI